MNELDKIYFKMLQSGLIAIRGAAKSGDLPHCHAEAEHLHNMPSLIGEENKQRHLYYYFRERVSYLEWVASQHREDLNFHVSADYAPYWKKMVLILNTMP